MGITRRKTGKQHGMSGTPEWRAWRDMLARCQCPTNEAFDDYGARGIAVCDRWSTSFVNFFTDMGKRPGPKYSLDREDNDKGYKPDNCRWATKKQQARNRRICRIDEDDAAEILRLLGEGSLLQKEIANKFNINRPMVSLIKSGRHWS